jgi:hypothetical protein
MRWLVALLPFSGCLGVVSIVHTAPVAPIHFLNSLEEAVCAINLWRDEQPAAEADANWLELTDQPSLMPGERTSVGARLSRGPYRLRAISCTGRAIVQTELSSLRADQVIELSLPKPMDPPL